VIVFKSVTMQNFMSYGAVPTTIELDRPGTIFMSGENLDNTANGIRSNGVGKTTLLNAIVYCLYDKPVSTIKKLDNLINWVNKKNMIVSVEFEKDGSTYVVTRGRKTKAGAGNLIQIIKDGEDITPASKADDKIIEIIGIKYELFVRIVTFSATHTPFFDLPTRHASQTNQTDIIEELFDIVTLSTKAEALKVIIKDTELALEAVNERHEQLEKEHERYAKQLEAARLRVSNWEANNLKEIEKLNTQIQGLKVIDVTEQRLLLEELERLETELEQVIQEQMKSDAEITTIQKTMTDLSHELKHLDSGHCPYCKQDFHIATKDKKKIEAALHKAQENHTAVSLKYREAAGEVKKQSSNYKKLKAKLAVENLEQLLQIKNSITQLQTKCADLMSAVNPFLDPLQELEAIKLDEKDMSTVNELNLSLTHQTFLLKLLTKKDSFVRKAILNKNIPFLNQRMQKYLVDLGLPHTVEFTHEMTANISQFGHEADFGNLSNGQKACVNIALSFAFRDVLQSMHDHVNICLLDEVLDVGLDDISVQAAAKMLKHKAREEKLALYIISHRNELNSAFDRKMIVQLSGGFSSLRYEDE
jgi:DNA repair exonuclease SbcCD ATPase subunit